MSGDPDSTDRTHVYESSATGEELDQGEATRLLRAAADGSQQEQVRVLELLYRELRGIAERVMRGERADHTLQPTVLVHEVWLRVFDPGEARYQDRNHFLATAAQAMRHLLVDHARARRRLKRGKGWQRVPMDDALGVEEVPDGGAEDLVQLDEALDALAAENARAAKVVELRYFGGLSVEETSAALETSPRTVAREWRFARAWLSERLDPA